LEKEIEQYVITNAVTDTAKNKLGLSGLDRFMKKLFISGQIGVPKPAKGFFDVVLSEITEKDPERILVEKAYKKPQGTEEEISNAIKGLNFEMNFQQLKPSCCDVFIWIAVWLDDIDIWVIPSSKIVMRPENAPRRKPKESIVSAEGTLYMGTQHQGGKGGDVPEGQIFVTNNHYEDLKRYKVSLETLIEKIKEAKNNGNFNQRT
jgi:hypothetical protein